MADADPLLALSLAPGERVLWQGRPPLGAPWPGPAALVWAGLQGWLALLAVAIVVIVSALLAEAFGAVEALKADTVAISAMAASVVGGPLLIAVVLAVIAVSKRVGPFYGSIFVLGLWGPSFAIFWTNLVSAHGWSGALERLETDDLAAAVLLVGLPTVKLALGVTHRLTLLHVITDRRVAEVTTRRAGAPRLLWEAPRDGLRVERTWRSPRGLLVVGAGSTRRTLRVRDDDPARVLDDVQAPAPPG